MTYEELEAKCWKLEHDNQELKEQVKKDSVEIASLTDRYIEAEKWITGLREMSLWRRVFFISEEVADFITSRLKKYDY